MSQATNPWAAIGLDDLEERSVSVGPLTVRLKRQGDEVWLAHHAVVEDGALEPEPEWSRWALGEHHRELRVLPSFPDRVLVVSPEHPFTLLRQASARVYVRIPVFVRVAAAERKGELATIREVPTVVLSDTWWGDFAAGELAYWLPTKARRAVSPELFEPHLAIATLQLVNRSQSELPVEKLALRLDHLGLYHHQGALWAEETVVQYHGENEGSDNEPQGRPPPEALGADLLVPAREASGIFRTRTFARLRALSGLGG